MLACVKQQSEEEKEEAEEKEENVEERVKKEVEDQDEGEESGHAVAENGGEEKENVGALKAKLKAMKEGNNCSKCKVRKNKKK